jgi:hypothetical protein
MSGCSVGKALRIYFRLSGQADLRVRADSTRLMNEDIFDRHVA